MEIIEKFLYNLNDKNHYEIKLLCKQFGSDIGKLHNKLIDDDYYKLINIEKDLKSVGNKLSQLNLDDDLNFNQVINKIHTYSESYLINKLIILYDLDNYVFNFNVYDYIIIKLKDVNEFIKTIFNSLIEKIVSKDKIKIYNLLNQYEKNSAIYDKDVINNIIQYCNQDDISKFNFNNIQFAQMNEIEKNEICIDFYLDDKYLGDYYILKKMNSEFNNNNDDDHLLLSIMMEAYLNEIIS